MRAPWMVAHPGCSGSRWAALRLVGHGIPCVEGSVRLDRQLSLYRPAWRAERFPLIPVVSPGCAGHGDCPLPDGGLQVQGTWHPWDYAVSWGGSLKARS
jgi:hypothetical protein